MRGSNPPNYKYGTNGRAFNPVLEQDLCLAIRRIDQIIPIHVAWKHS